MSISKTTVFSNSWIALSAAACTGMTALLANQSLSNYYPAIALLFFATWARYNIIAFTLPKSVTGEKFLFMQKHSTLLKIIFVVSALASGYFAYLLTWQQLLFLSHLALLTLWYIFPIPLGFIKLKPLRKLPFLKIFLIAYVWACSTYIMPIQEQLELSLNTLLAFTERFLFLFSITLPFDIKDYKDDIRLKLQTIPNSFGIRNTKLVATGCLILGALITCYIYPISISTGFVLSYLITWPFVWNANTERSDIYFLGWVDGTMVWQFLLVFATSKLLPFVIN